MSPAILWSCFPHLSPFDIAYMVLYLSVWRSQVVDVLEAAPDLPQLFHCLNGGREQTERLLQFDVLKQ